MAAGAGAGTGPSAVGAGAGPSAVSAVSAYSTFSSFLSAKYRIRHRSIWCCHEVLFDEILLTELCQTKFLSSL